MASGGDDAIIPSRRKRHNVTRRGHRHNVIASFAGAGAAPECSAARASGRCLPGVWERGAVQCSGDAGRTASVFQGRCTQCSAFRLFVLQPQGSVSQQSWASRQIEGWSTGDGLARIGRGAWRRAHPRCTVCLAFQSSILSSLMVICCVGGLQRNKNEP